MCSLFMLLVGIDYSRHKERPRFLSLIPSHTPPSPPEYSTSYTDHLHIVKGEKQYLFDPKGTRYLDCVNNVCHGKDPECVCAPRHPFCPTTTTTAPHSICICIASQQAT